MPWTAVLRQEHATEALQYGAWMRQAEMSDMSLQVVCAEEWARQAYNRKTQRRGKRNVALISSPAGSSNQLSTSSSVACSQYEDALMKEIRVVKA